MPNAIDISATLAGQVSVKPEEDPAERAARLRAEERGALIEDCKGIALFSVVLVGMIAIGILSVHEGFYDAIASAETKRWSQTVLSALVTGGVSFVVGRKMGKQG